MNIPENATRNEITIQGLPFSVPIVVSPENFNESISGVCSIEMAAQILQQTFSESWRNNFAKTVTAAIKVAADAADITFKTVKDLSDEDAQTINEAVDSVDLQEKLDAYIATYEPGVRRTSGGESLSPVDRETNKLAVELVRDYLERDLGVGRTSRSETYKAWDAKIQEEMGVTGAEYIADLSTQLIEANPAIRETAEANIASRANLASNIALKFSEAEA